MNCTDGILLFAAAEAIAIARSNYGVALVVFSEKVVRVDVTSLARTRAAKPPVVLGWATAVFSSLVTLSEQGCNLCTSE